MNGIVEIVRNVRGNAGSAPDRETGVDLPCKPMSLTFHVTLVPDNIVDIRAGGGDIREQTFELIAKAQLPDGRLAVAGVYAPIWTRGVSNRTQIPTSLRVALQRHLIAKEGTA